MKYIASDIQRQYWLQDQLLKENIAYNISSVFKIEKTVSIDALKKALFYAINCDPVFKSCFIFEDGTLYCQQKKADITVDFIETSYNGEEILNTEAKGFIAQPFDLEIGPLLRGCIWQASDYYILAISVHHIAIDLRTKDLLGIQISVFYNKLIQSQELQIIEKEITYENYAAWYNKWKHSEKAKKAEEFWEKNIPATVSAIDLPTKKIRPPVFLAKGSVVPIKIKKQQFEKIIAFAQKAASDPYLILLTAYAALLHRYTLGDNFSIGIPLTNRVKDEHKEIFGCLMNILPIIFNFDQKTSFSQLLGQARKKMLLAHRHQSLPFAQIVEKINPPRDRSKNPLYQTLFTFEHPMKLSLKDTPSFPVYLHPGGAQLDISLVLWKNQDSFEGHIEYYSDAFEHSAIERMANHYLNIINLLLDNPLNPVSLPCLLTKDEKELVVKKWNQTEVNFEPVSSINELFERQVLKTPNAIALEMQGQESYTYEQFNKKANQLAHFLVENSVKPQDTVGIYFQRSYEMVLSIYAICKAGAVYVPLDPEYPSRRLQEIIEDANPRAVLYLGTLGLELKNTKAVDLAKIEEQLCSFSSENLSSCVGPKDNAYLIFTSGSTGRPKGVLNTHEGICNRIYWMQQEYKINHQDAILQKTPFSFDVSVWEFFWPLMSGAKLAICPPGLHRDPAALCEIISHHSITTIHFVPSMLEAFLDSPVLSLCKSLRYIISSGEALSASLAKNCLSKLPSAQLHNLYGPTEAAVDVTNWPCKQDNMDTTVPIGKPIANTTIYILDEFLNPTPIGVPGELHIGGVQVARGYIGRPDLTAEKFIPDPFSDKKEARLYKTGDLATFLEDGSIEYIGRTDFQVKLHGLRIELDEINAAISEESRQIAQVVTIVDQDGPDAALVSYLVIKDNQNEVINSLKENLKKRLPSYMVPEQYILLDQIPLTPNGKADRKKLPKPVKEISKKLIGQSPVNSVEIDILDIWKELLNLTDIGVNINFFDAGGTSILAAHLVNRLSRKFDTKISLVSIFEYPTIKQFAQFIAKDSSGDEETIQKSIDRSEKMKAARNKKKRIRQ